MKAIKFGTDGWRAIIGKDYTIESLCRVAEATGKWLLKQKSRPSVVIGHDPRFGGRMFAETVCKVLGQQGVMCHLADGFVSTPMVSLGTVTKNADLGIVITASHNPPSYNGFKLKGPYGGPLVPEKITEIEELIPDAPSIDPEKVTLDILKEKKLFASIDLEQLYIDQVEKHFNLEKIRRSGIRLAYDGMFGAGQEVIRKILPDAVLFRCQDNPGFQGQAPEPIHKNLTNLSEYIRQSGDIDFGFATDGDADRIGVYDEQGKFVDSHHVILLLINYLVSYKKMSGKVVTAFSVTPKVNKICSHFSLAHQTTKIGFKYIAGIMVNEDVLLGGEESGGIAVKGHIPERDGIWIGLLLLEYMATTGKSISQLISDVYSIVGPFAFERSDLHLNEDIKNRIVANCEKNAYQSFGSYKIQRTENVDGYKYFFNDDEWFLVRASGTEPVLRNYAQSSTQQTAFEILKAAEQTFMNGQ